jgi:ATP-dependent Clp protease protease subunit
MYEMNYLAPTVIEETPKGRISYDIFSRLTKDRIVVVIGEVDDSMAASVVAQLLFLAAQDPNKDISMYINSPGGMVTAGMAIYDTMQLIPCDIQTVGMGMCASMGSVLLAGGTKGKRCVLPHTEVMIHQPSGGSKGQATEMEIAYKQIQKTKKTLTELLAERCGQPYEVLLADMERDHYMNAEESLRYGIVDEIITELGKHGMTKSDLEEREKVSAESNSSTEENREE